MGTAIWTGTEMVIWGGFDQDESALDSGGRYNPSTDRWLPISRQQVLVGRGGHTWAIWTGTEMVIWGGFDQDESALDSGGRYNLITDRWLPLSQQQVPGGRGGHTAIWTGTEMVIWGGFDQDELALDSGGRYNPSTD